MCGIVAVSFKKNNEEHAEDGMYIFKWLLDENTERGKHSSGIAYLCEDGVKVSKGTLTGVLASNLVVYDDGFLGYLGHTRFSTVGKPSYSNAHPFRTKKYVGVHNGTIFNYKHLIQEFNLEPKGDTDSEVVFLLMDKIGHEAAIQRLDGIFSLAFSEVKNPGTIFVITNGSRPVNCIQYDETTAFGSIIEGTYKALKAEMKHYNFKVVLNSFPVPPKTLFEVNDGKIISRKELPIREMTEAEADYEYYYNFLVAKRDHYMMAIPLNRRLPEPKHKNAGANFKAEGALSSPVSDWCNKYCDLMEALFHRAFIENPVFTGASIVRSLQTVNISFDTLAQVDYSNTNYMYAQEQKEVKSLFEGFFKKLTNLNKVSSINNFNYEDLSSITLLKGLPFGTQWFLDILAMSEKIHLYSSTLTNKHLKAADILTAAFMDLGYVNKKDYEASQAFLGFVNSALIHPKIVEKEIDNITQYASCYANGTSMSKDAALKRGPLFDNPFYGFSSYQFGPIAGEDADNEEAFKTILKEKNVSYSPAEFFAVARATLFGMILVRVVEMMASKENVKGRVYVPLTNTTATMEDPLTSMAHEIYINCLSGNKPTMGPVSDLRKALTVDISKRPHPLLRSNKQIFERLTIEALATVFGRISAVFRAPTFSDMPMYLNSISKKAALNGAICSISRALLIRRFLLTGESYETIKSPELE